MEKLMGILNYTPHTLNIHDEEGKVLVLKSVGEARCETVSDFDENLVHDDCEVLYRIPVSKVSYGKVSGLTDTIQKNTVYVVSLLVAQSLPNRCDLLSPGELIRDDSGRPVGCRGLRRV